MPFVTTLTTDATTISSPTWADVEREILALNAATQTLVMLAPAPPLGAPEGDHHLAVGGGGDSRYIVFTTEDNLTFWNLVDLDRHGDARKVRMLIGGQEGEYVAAQFVSRDMALRAAHRYFEDGRRADDLMWSS
ncbi:MAG: hypothetical protein JST00_04890 [Deltaproteobacteria bacterium]|nr:hypothetical protein [Deltaproteobacteria bacterium]